MRHVSNILSSRRAAGDGKMPDLHIENFRLVCKCERRCGRFLDHCRVLLHLVERIDRRTYFRQH